MAFQPFEHWVNADLKAEVPVVQLRNGFFTQDNLGALLGVKVFDNGQEHALTGSVLYYAKLADGTTLESDSVQPDGNAASVVLPSEAYAAVGPISVAIANRDGAKQKVLAIFTGYVYETKTDAEVAPGQTVADLAQLQALYSEMQAAVSSAQTVANGAVLYNAAQSLTDAQKLQTQNNIGVSNLINLADDVSDLKSASMLQAETIPDTVQTIVFDSLGNVQSITHMRGNVAVRTDIFTFGTGTITEVRTLYTGESLTIVTNTDTLVTTVTYAAA